MINSYKFLEEEFEGEISVGSPWRWRDNTKIDLEERGCKFVDWIQLAQNGTQ
jgi:hypothetical protein